MLTQWLMEIPSATPGADGGGAIHGSRAAQNTLGAAYMLPQRRPRRSASPGRASACRGDLTESMGSSERLIAAHEQCVADYSAFGPSSSPRTGGRALAAARCEGHHRRRRGGRRRRHREPAAARRPPRCARRRWCCRPHARRRVRPRFVRIKQVWTDDEHGDGDDDDDDDDDDAAPKSKRGSAAYPRCARIGGKVRADR